MIKKINLPKATSILDFVEQNNILLQIEYGEQMYGTKFVRVSLPDYKVLFSERELIFTGATEKEALLKLISIINNNKIYLKTNITQYIQCPILK